MQRDQLTEATREPYEAPLVRDLGAVAEVTRGALVNPTDDNGIASL